MARGGFLRAAAADGGDLEAAASDSGGFFAVKYEYFRRIRRGNRCVCTALQA